MPEAKLFSCCNGCGVIQDDVLAWETENYHTYLNWKSPLAKKVQAHHDIFSAQGHNKHDIYITQADAENENAKVGFIVVSSTGFFTAIIEMPDTT